jgi:hypothetical protein
LDENWFINCVLNDFHYLIDGFGFEVIEIDSQGLYDYVLYQNATTAVAITREPMDGYLEVTLMRLCNAELPSYEDTENGKLLPLLLDRRAPQLNIKNNKVYDQSAQADVIAQYARALREYGSDILGGDFSIFPLLKRSDFPSENEAN